MDFYPPDSNTAVGEACREFQGDNKTSLQKIGNFLQAVTLHEEGSESPGPWEKDKKKEACFDMSSLQPDYGRYKRISSSDWSGIGPGKSAYMWEFQCCTELSIRTGFSAYSMFPEREWSLEWLTDHCQKRFGVTPQPTAMVDAWHFDDLVAAGASRVLFTNGMNDGWVTGSYTTDLSDSIVALNFPNGAHHSDLTHTGPSDEDTDDIKEGHKQIAAILGEWLHKVKQESKSS
jgi:hypothetical protein